jgi:hypothetical protein
LGDISVKFWKDWLVYLKVLVLLVLLVRMHSATQKLATKECNYKYCSHNLVSIVICTTIDVTEMEKYVTLQTCIALL